MKIWKNIFNLWFALSAITSAQALSVVQRIPLMVSEATDRALILTVSDAGTYWISECEVRQDDVMSFIERASRPDNQCRRLHPAALSVTDKASAETLETLTNTFFKEMMQERLRGTRFSSIIFVATGVVGISSAIAHVITATSVKEFKGPALITLGLGLIGGISYVLEGFFTSTPQTPDAPKSLIQSVGTNDQKSKGIETEDYGMYYAYKSALKKALEIVATDHSKVPAPK